MNKNVQVPITEKIPPYDIYAEEAVIGSLLVDGDVIYELSSSVNVDDFFTQQCKWIYEVCIMLMNRGEMINQITIAHELSIKGRLDEIGGAAYLSQLISQTPTSEGVVSYAKIVKDTAIARRTIKMGIMVSNIGYTESEPTKMVSETEKLFLNLQKEVAMPKLYTPETVAYLSTQRYTELAEGKRRGVYTGFEELDSALGGLFGGELLYIAGRPGTGKTENLLSIAEYVGLKFGNVLMASLEQPLDDIIDRYVGRNLELSPRRIRAGVYPDELMKKIMGFVGGLSKSRIYFYESGGDATGRSGTTSSIYSIANHMKLAYGLSLILIDYLGLVEDASDEKSYERISLISRKLKKMSRTLDVPIICAAQLNREVERRMGNHKPQISDIRDSGNVEQDADIIIFIYRPEKYQDEIDEAQKDGRDITNKAYFIIGKHRQCGEVADVEVPLLWLPHKRYYIGRTMQSGSWIFGNREPVPESFR